MVRILFEFDTNDGTTVAKRRFCTGPTGFMTKASETPSRAKYYPFIKDGGNIYKGLFIEGSTEGAFNISNGVVKLTNASGQLDYLKTHGLAGYDFDIREERGPSYPSDFPIIFSGTIDYVEFNSNDVLIYIKDRTSIFTDLNLQDYKYSGDNDGSTIELEGTSDDIGGTPKPLIWGNVKNITPVMVNEAKDIYQVSSEPCTEINEVYVGRASLTVGTQFTSLSSFLSATPSSGTYDYYLGNVSASAGSNDRGCYFRLGTTPSHVVTCDITNGGVNQATYNEDFTNGVWSYFRASVIGDVIEGVDGANQADKIVENTETNTHLLARNFNAVDNSYYIFGVIAKAAERDSLRLVLFTPTFNVTSTRFDLSTGVSTAVIGSTVEHSMIDLGNGYYFCYIIDQAIASGSSLVNLRLENESNADNYTGDGSSGLYLNGLIFADDNKPSYVSCEATEESVNHIPGLLYKIMKHKGYDLNFLSKIKSQRQFNHPVQHYQNNSEIQTGEVIKQIKDSALFYLTTDRSGNYKTAQLELPTAGESVKTFSLQQVLGGFNRSKIVEIANKDQEKSIPNHSVKIGYEQNYTLLNKEQLTGVADTQDELAYVSSEFRYTQPVEDNTILTKHLKSKERSKVTKLSSLVGANALTQYEFDIFSEKRDIISFKIPLGLCIKLDGNLIEEGDVLTIENKHYRVLATQLRLPSGSRSETSMSLTFQAWGGV